MTFATIKLSLILFGLSLMLKFQRWRHEAFRKRLKERNFTAQIMARDEEFGRWFEFKDGNIRSGAGLHPDARLQADVQERRPSARTLLMPPINWLRQINAQKDFVLTVDGPEDLTNWFAQTVMMSQSAGLKIGTPHAGRLHALLQHDQRRAGLHLRQGRQDHPHDADRPHRG